MCRSDVKPEAEELLAELLRDMAVVLCPDAPETVVVGPVDFGCDPSEYGEQARPPE